MDVRRLVRGTVEWERLELVVRELAERYGRETVRVEFLEADNWLSTPLVVDRELFVKIISIQNVVVHGVFTGARNLGAVTAGTEHLFEHCGTPLEMAERELDATRRMRAVGVNAPEPVEAFEVDGLGVLVLEYLPEFQTLDELDDETVATFAPTVFESLAVMHEDGLAHGDLRAENVLVADGELYFVDATTVRDRARAAARSYDIASALAMLTPRIGAPEAVAAARLHYSGEDLIAARDFLDFVSLRPDHDFDAQRVKGEVEKAAA